MRLIDADGLKERLKNDPLFPIVERYNVTGVVETQPTVDAVEVVRCKDCVYARKINTHSNGRRNYKCYKYSMFNNVCGKTITYEVLVDDNHYCAYGEREEEWQED